MDKKALRGKKKAMYEALVSQLGIVTAAVNQVGINRRTHYLWLDKDENYKMWVTELPELALDFAENALFKLMKDRNTAAVIFYLKTKGKGRGYIERVEHDNKHSGKLDVNNFKFVIDNGDNQTIKETAPGTTNTK